jgi:hypothetical protein
MKVRNIKTNYVTEIEFSHAERLLKISKGTFEVAEKEKYKFDESTGVLVKLPKKKKKESKPKEDK